MSGSPVQGLWIGGRLSSLERLSVESFLQNGHQYHLYVYDEVDNVPDQAVVKDAEEVLPRRDVFKHRRFDSYAPFSDKFRYKLLFDKGGWWADADVVCLRPFDFSSPYVFCEQSHRPQVVNNAVMKTPAGCEIMEYCHAAVADRIRDDMRWGDTGPAVLSEGLTRFNLSGHVLPSRVVNPIRWEHWRDAISGSPLVRLRVRLGVAGNVYAVHLWNEMWRRAGADKDATYPSHCLYERLKRRYMTASGSRHDGDAL